MNQPASQAIYLASYFNLILFSSSIYHSNYLPASSPLARSKVKVAGTERSKTDHFSQVCGKVNRISILQAVPQPTLASLVQWWSVSLASLSWPFWSFIFVAAVLLWGYESLVDVTVMDGESTWITGAFFGGMSVVLFVVVQWGEAYSIPIAAPVLLSMVYLRYWLRKSINVSVMTVLWSSRVWFDLYSLLSP